MSFFSTVFNESGTKSFNSNQIDFPFDEIKELGGKCASFLSNQDLNEGDRVGILCFNSPITIAAILGCLIHGVKPILLNWRLSSSEIQKVHELYQIDFLIYDTSFLQLILTIEEKGVPCLSDEELGTELLLMDSVRDYQYKGDSICLMTSGTTGVPKLIELKSTQFEFLCTRLESYFMLLDQSANFLLLPPLYTIAGIGFLIFSLWKGSFLTLPNFYNKEETGTILRSSEDHVTHVFMVPSMIKDHEQDILNSSLKHIHYGGAKVTHNNILKLISENGIALTQGYGLTETAGIISILSNEDHLEIFNNGKDMFTGQVLKDINVKLNKGGELLVSGSNINFDDPVIKPKSEFRDGKWWFNTEDVVTLIDGRITVFDRSDDMIISKGSNIYPSEIESSLVLHEDIDDVCAFGIEDEEYGQYVVAFVTSSKKDLNIDDLKDWSSKYLASYKFPKKIKRVEFLPKNGSGKFDRKVLRENWLKK